jgi:hypothetical protein
MKLRKILKDAITAAGVANDARKAAEAAKNKKANKASLVGPFNQARPGDIIRSGDQCYQARQSGGRSPSIGWYPVACPPGK